MIATLILWPIICSNYKPWLLGNCKLASSPAPSQLFSLAGKKREKAWDLKSRDKCWQLDGVALALPQSVDFKPIWRLWSIKQSSARPLRIVLPSLIASSPAPSQLFSLAGKKRERAWDLKSRDKCWQNGVALALPQSVRFQTCLASSVDQTKLCEASKDRTTLADSQCCLLFHPY